MTSKPGYPLTTEASWEQRNSNTSEQATEKTFLTLSTGKISESSPITTPADKPVKKAARYSAKQWLTLITLAYGNFCIGSCVSLQAPFFPREAELKGATPTQYGFIFGMYQLTIFAVAPLVGKTVTYINPNFVLNAGFFTVGATMILFGCLDKAPYGTTFVVLAFAVRIMEGIGAAAMKTSTYIIIATNFKDKMATTFASLETFLGLGLITGPTVGGLLYDVGGYGLPFFVVGCLVLVDVVVIYFVLPELEKNPDIKTGNMSKFWLNPGTILYAFTVFIAFTCIGFLHTTLEPHLRQFNLSGVLLGCMFVIQGTMYAITAPTWGWLCDRGLNSRIISLIGCFLTCIYLLFIGPAPFFAFGTKIWLAIISLVLFGISLGAKLVSTFIGTMKDTIARGFPSDITTYGLVSSMFASSQSLGAFVGPVLGGFLLDSIGFRKGTLVLFCVELVLMMLVFGSVISDRLRRRGGTPEEKKALLDTREAASSEV